MSYYCINEWKHLIVFSLSDNPIYNNAWFHNADKSYIKYCSAYLLLA